MARAPLPPTQEFELTQTQPMAPPVAMPAGDCVARLQSLTGDLGPYEIKKDKKEVLIGRHPDCDIVVGDKRVSGRHLRIYCDESQRYFAQELSTNKCWLNDNLMDKDDTRVLQHGDTLSLCVRVDAHDAPNELHRPFAAWVFRVTGHDGLTGNSSAPSVFSSTATSDGAIGSRRPRHIVMEQWVSERWDMRTVIGSGNFSEVRLGLKVKDAKTYAVKVIDVRKFYQFQTKRESQLSLSSEAEVLTSLDHTGIIKFYEFFETEDKLFLIMELMSGGDLLQCILEHGLLEEYQAYRLFKQLCDAVKYLHDKNFVHRDLKPENILLNAKDRDTMVAKIADFGLARITHKTRDCKTFCGTPHYFAPEVINTFRGDETGVRGYDKQADMWSLGVILYIMLSGIPPFEEENLYDQITEGKYEFDVDEWKAVTSEAKELVKKLMTVNPKYRFTVIEALEHMDRCWRAPALVPPQQRSFDPPADEHVTKKPRLTEDVDTSIGAQSNTDVAEGNQT